MKNDKPIRLSESEDALLRRLYTNFRIPRDQYKERPVDQVALEQTWHNLSGRTDSWQELVRYMQNQQKAKQRLAVPWPVFNGAHKRAPVPSVTITEDHMEALHLAYSRTVLPLGIGDDAAIWHEEAVSALADEFARLTGTILPGTYLLAIAEKKRKRGLWLKVGKGGAGWSDLDQLGQLDEAASDEE